MSKLIYLIGALKNPAIPEMGQFLRASGFRVFDDWYSPGPETDQFWQQYEQARGHTYIEALDGHAANLAFGQDKKWLDSCDGAVLIGPAGKSAHLELGYVVGRGKPGWILLDKEPDRWDLMVKFAAGVFLDRGAMVESMKRWHRAPMFTRNTQSIIMASRSTAQS